MNSFSGRSDSPPLFFGVTFQACFRSTQRSWKALMTPQVTKGQRIIGKRTLSQLSTGALAGRNRPRLRSHAQIPTAKPLGTSDAIRKVSRSTFENGHRSSKARGGIRNAPNIEKEKRKYQNWGKGNCVFRFQGNFWICFGVIVRKMIARLRVHWSSWTIPSLKVAGP